MRPAARGAPALVFVVNNNDDPHRAFGGTHWSVLVFERRSGEFFALDSIRGTNDAAAAALASSLAPLLLGPDARRPTPVRAHPMLPAQTNAHDCGVYACLDAVADCDCGRRASLRSRSARRAKFAASLTRAA